jgi:hypothetical protein
MTREAVDIDVRPGVILVMGDHGAVYAREGSIVALTVDLKSRWAVVSGLGSGDDVAPCVYLDANQDTENIAKIEVRSTLISFPGFVGWNVFNASVGKSVLHVTLIKDEVK